MLLRIVLTVFGVDFSFGDITLQHVLLVMAVLAMLSGSLMAIYQGNVKRVLAYSSIAQIGYMVLGIGLASATGIAASVLHVFNHALMKTALFMTLGAIFYRIGSVALEDLHGIAKRMPWTMGAFVAGGLSIIGVPLTVGFISKWYLLLAATQQGWWWLAAIILISSLIAVVYIWRIVEAAYFKPVSNAAKDAVEAPLGLLLPTWALVVLNVYFGIDATWTASMANQISATLLGTRG
jgi:multicomponent Na+:H+ antiporter subunit D